MTAAKRKYADDEFIAKVGIELEGGGWRDGCNTPGWKGDGSVNDELGSNGGSCECDSDYDCECNDAGEVVSEPYETWYYTRKFLLREWPSNVDGSCGLHVHTSFTQPEYYQALMHPKFWLFFTQRWNAFVKRNWRKHDLGRLVYRLQGRNNYCQAQFKPSQQVISRGDRYTQLNFCYSKHGTIECRLLPMFGDKSGGVQMAIRAIRYLLNTYQLFLRDFDFDQLEIETESSDLDAVDYLVLDGRIVDSIGDISLSGSTTAEAVPRGPLPLRQVADMVGLQLNGEVRTSVPLVWR